jgi:hypothetical protein
LDVVIAAWLTDSKSAPAALRMVLMALTGWLAGRERQALGYLIEGNRRLPD